MDEGVGAVHVLILPIAANGALPGEIGDDFLGIRLDGPPTHGQEFGFAKSALAAAHTRGRRRRRDTR